MSKTTGMPKIDLSKCNLTASEMELARGIVNTKTGELRASKPAVNTFVAFTVPQKTSYGVYNREFFQHDDTGKTAFIWRHVAFSISPKSQHHCMPCTDVFDLPKIYTTDKDESGAFKRDYNAERIEEKRLMDIADRIINSVPKSEWYGVKRWGQAFGMIGTPEYNSEGAVVYR